MAESFDNWKINYENRISAVKSKSSTSNNGKNENGITPALSFIKENDNKTASAKIICTNSSMIQKNDANPSINLKNLKKLVILTANKNYTSETEVNRKKMAESAFTKENQQKVVFSVLKKGNWTLAKNLVVLDSKNKHMKKALVIKKDIVDLSNTQTNPKNFVVSESKVDTNNIQINRKTIIDPSIAQTNPKNFVISDIKNDCTSKTQVLKRGIVVDPSNAQTNSKKFVVFNSKNDSTRNVQVTKKDIVDISNTQINPKKFVVLESKDDNTNNNQVNRKTIIDPSIAQTNPKNFAVLDSKSDCTKNLQVTKRDIVDPSNPLSNPKNFVSESKDDDTNNSQVNRKTIIDPSIGQKNPKNFAVLDSKSDCTRNIQVTKRDIVDLSSTQTNPKNFVVSDSINDCTSNARLITKVIVDPLTGQSIPKNFVVILSKNDCTNNIQVTRTNMADLSVTQTNHKDPGVKESYCKNETIENIHSTLHSSLNNQKEQLSEGTQCYDTSVHVWSGGFKNQNDVRDSSCSKTPNMSIFNIKKCRICLNEGSIPIYVNSDEDLADAIMTIGGVEISPKDHYHKYLCDDCFEQLQSAIVFRITAQQTDKLFKKLRESVQEPLTVQRTETPETGNSSEMNKDDTIAGAPEKQLQDHKKSGLDITNLNDKHKNHHFNSHNKGFHHRKIEIHMNELGINRNFTMNNVMPCDGGEIHKDKNNILTEHNKQNNSEVLTDVESALCTIQYNSNQTLKNISKASPESTIIGEPTHNQSMDNILQEKTDNKITTTLDSSDTDDYFGDSTMMREPTILDITKIYYKTTKVICKECNLHFNSFKNYIDHMMKYHPERKKLKCGFCQKHFSLSHIERHLKNHRHGGFTCEICGKHYLDKNNFKNHCMTHTLHLPFKCSICNYRGRTMKAVKQHMRSHTGHKPHKCPQCPYLSINSGNLQKHILKHLGVTPFKCDTCKCGFYCKGDLAKHLKYVHFGVKRNLCRICGEHLKTNKLRNEHEHLVHNRPMSLCRRASKLQVRYEFMKQQENKVLET